MARPGVLFLRRAPLSGLDVLRAARRHFAIPLLATAVVLVPYVLVTSQKPPPPPELIALGHAQEDPPDPWPLRGAALGLLAWAGLTARELAAARRARTERLVRLDPDELECWSGGRRRHVALQDVVGVRLEQRAPGRGLKVSDSPIGAVVYARTEGATLEAVRVDLGAHSLEGGAALQDGNVWLVERLRYLVAERRNAGRPVARCPRRAVSLTARREVALGGDERCLSVTSGNQHAMVPPGALRAVRLLAPRADEPDPPVRVAELELAPGCGPDKVLVPLDDGAADEAVLEELEFWSCRLDLPA